MGVITIGAKDFVKGVSTSDDLPDAGYSNRAKGHNLLANPGTLNGQPTSTIKTSGLTANEAIVATSDVGSNGNNFDRYFVTEGQDFFTQKFNEDPAKVHDGTLYAIAEGKVNVIVFDDNVYVRASDEINKITGSNVATLLPKFWTSDAGGTTLGGATGPMLTFDRKLWVGNGNELHYTDGSTATENLLPLDNEEWIYALGIYEPTGDMLISVDVDGNGSGKYTGSAKILVWDGFSEVRNREIRIDEVVTSFLNVGGVTYVVSGNTFGYFNGNGITPLKRLNIGYTQAELIYPNKICQMNGTVYIAEGSHVLAYGKLYPGGERVFYYPFTTGTDKINTISAFVNDSTADAPYLAVTYELNGTAPRFVYFNIKDDGSGSGAWYSNKVYLPSNSRITKVEVNTDVLASGDVVNFEILKSSTDEMVEIGSMNYETDGAITQKTLARNKKIETNVIQVSVGWGGGNPKISQIKIYYDAIEKRI